jgi:hypothetical protein
MSHSAALGATGISMAALLERIVAAPKGPGGEDQVRMRSWGLLRKRDDTGRHVMTRERGMDGKEVVAFIGILLPLQLKKRQRHHGWAQEWSG